MIIIHIITAFGIGGAEKLLLNVINKQIKNNEVHLIYFKNKNDLVVDLNKRVSVKHIPLNLFTVKKLKQYYKNVNPNVVHTHLGHADLIGLWSARKLNVKIFCTMHNIYFQKNFIDLFYFKAYSLLFEFFIKSAHMISISKSVERHVLNRLKIPKNRSHLLMNAIPKSLNIEAKKDSQINLLFVGRLEKQKSVATLIKSIKRYIDNDLETKLHLDILGDGSLREELEKLVLDLRIQNIISFRGEQKNVNNYYAKADIFVLPSIWEGFGIVILEAFRAKIAVIASNIEGPAELIKDNYNGLLFEPKNEMQLTEKIIFLIKNEAKRKEIAEKGFNSFSKKYTIENYVKELNKLYTNV